MKGRVSGENTAALVENIDQRRPIKVFTGAQLDCRRRARRESTGFPQKTKLNTLTKLYSFIHNDSSLKYPFVNVCIYLMYTYMIKYTHM